jgi:hypothetical protein
VLALTWVAEASAAPPVDAAPNEHADLIKLGESLLDPTDTKPKAARAVDVLDAAPDVAAADAEVDATVDSGVVDAAEAVAVPDAGAAELVTKPPPEPSARTTSPLPLGRGGAGRAARNARVESGKNFPMQAAEDSPLAKIGVPAQLVPVAATAVAAGGMALWPFLVKTLTGILKGLTAGLLKNRAKKSAKLDKTASPIALLGFRIPTKELGALVLGAMLYGLAMSYTFVGWKLSSSFVLKQEGLVLTIALARTMVRFYFERAFKLATQYKFWLGGSMLCLGSAYLGSTMSTVGFELEEAKTPEDATRAVKLKLALIGLALVLAFAFFGANILSPSKIWQTGRAATSGMALGEILPIAPMPGLKIFKWRPSIWVPLFVIVATSFLLLNFIL